MDVQNDANGKPVPYGRHGFQSTDVDVLSMPLMGPGVGESGIRRILVIAPFISFEQDSSRPRLAAEVLSRFGDVDILTTSFDHRCSAARAHHQLGTGMTVHHINVCAYRSHRSPARARSHLQFARGVSTWVEACAHVHDVIYATAPLASAARAAFEANKGALRILDVVDIWPDALPFSSTSRLILAPLMARWRHYFTDAVSQCDALMAVSGSALKTALPSFTGEACRTTAHPPSGNSLPCSQSHKRDEGRFRMAYLGNVGHLYDFATLLDAIDHLKDTLPVTLDVIGSGDRLPWLRKEASRRDISATFHGPAYDAGTLGKILGECDAGFNGYRNATAAFSYKATTYCSAGLPIINSTHGDLRENIREHDIGANYDSMNVRGLAEAIISVHARSGPSMRECVRKFFEHALDRDRARCVMGEFFEELLESPMEDIGTRVPVHTTA